MQSHQLRETSFRHNKRYTAVAPMMPAKAGCRRQSVRNFYICWRSSLPQSGTALAEPPNQGGISAGERFGCQIEPITGPITAPSFHLPHRRRTSRPLALARNLLAFVQSKSHGRLLGEKIGLEDQALTESVGQTRGCPDRSPDPSPVNLHGRGLRLTTLMPYLCHVASQSRAWGSED